MVWVHRLRVGLFTLVLLPFASANAQDWNTYLKQADSLSRAAELDSAISLAHLALDLSQPAGGAERDTAAVRALTWLGHFFRMSDHYDSSEYYYGEAISLGERIQGDQAPLIVPALRGLARARANQRRQSEAETLYLRAIGIQERVGSQRDPLLAALYVGLAHIYRRAGEYDSSVVLYQKSIDVFDQLPDSFAVQSAHAMNGLGIAFKNSHRYDRAEAEFLRALDIWTTQLGEYAYENSLVYTNLGNLYVRMGRYAEGEDCLQQSVEVVKRSRGANHRNVALAYYGLATLYQFTGRLQQAAEVQEQAVRIMREIFGETSMRMAYYQNRLAMLYFELGRYDEAEVLFQAAHRVWEHNLGRTHESDPVSLGNLASLYLSLGRFAEAEEITRYHQAWVDSAKGDQANLRAWTRVAVAKCCLAQGRPAEAEILLREALALGPDPHSQLGWDVINESNRGLVETLLATSDWHAADSVLDLVWAFVRAEAAGNASLVTGLHHLRARVRLGQGQFDQAVALCDSAYRFARQVYGQNDVHAVVSALQLHGRALAAAGHVDRGLVLAGDAVSIRRRNLRHWAPLMSERDALKFSRRYRDAVDMYCSIFASVQQPSDEQVRMAATVLLQGKGEVSDEVMRRQRHLLIGDTTAGRHTEALRIARYQLAQQFVKAGAVRDWEAQHRDLDSLSDRVRDLETELARAGYADRSATVDRFSLAELGRRVSKDAMLVEYVRSTAALRPLDTDHYFVVLVGGDLPLRVEWLGPARRIDSLVELYRDHIESLADMGMAASPEDQATYADIAGSLYDLLWRPIESEFTTGRVVYVSPDAALHRVAFAGLPRPNGQYLVEAHELRYLSAGRDLLRPRIASSPGGGLLAMGDPKFDASPQERREPATDATTSMDQRANIGTIRGIKSGCDDLQAFELSALPMTRAEVASVAQSWDATHTSGAAVHVGAAASEERLKLESPGTAAIHLATHGYFIGDQCDLGSGGGGLADEIGYIADNPLLLSGLCLAGAAYEDSSLSRDGEDGFLTAEEIVGLNLEGTELVVLSACESGLGQVADGEGVYGLRRAFLMAGAHTVVSSLWSVTDEDAAAQLSGLYEQSDRPVAERLRALQLERLEALRAQGLPDHPVSWAAWVAVGGR